MQLLERLLPLNAMATVRYVGIWCGIAIMSMSRITLRKKSMLSFSSGDGGLKSPHFSLRTTTRGGGSYC